MFKLILSFTVLISLNLFGATNYFVNASRPDNSGDGLTWPSAKKTIQAAVDLAHEGDVVHVAAGTYVLSAPVSVSAGITISGASANDTIVDGNRAVQCFSLASTAKVTEMTITKGYANNSGGGVSGGTVSNCTLTNNSAACIGWYGAAYHGCGGAAWGSKLYNCIISGNSATTSGSGFSPSGGGVCSCTLYNCLIIGNSLTSDYAASAGGAYGGYLYNCTITGNSASGPSVNSGSRDSFLYNCVSYPDSVSSTLSNCCIADPKYVGDGNFSLRSDSPCRDAGNNAHVVGTTDLTGNARIQNGTVDIGAYEYASTRTLFVNAARPNDDGDGMSWVSAKRTIQAAVDAASSGDIVLVTNGTYNVGTRVTPGWAVRNRLVITNDITVKSVGGAVVTVIHGSGTSAYGTTNAIRCVYMNRGVLDGFTLRSGATYSHTLSAYGENKGGGGVSMIGAVAGTEVRNCIIRENRAYDGGGVVSGYGYTCGRLVNCLITANMSTYGGASYWAVLQNCTITRNTALTNVGGAYCGSMTNSISYLNSGNNANHSSCTVNYSCSTPLPSGTGNTAADPMFLDTSISNSNYRLQATSPCINAGHNASVSLSKDLDGTQRIAAEVVDMGAYEYTPPTTPVATPSIEPSCESPIHGVFSVSIVCSEEGAVIRYTLDGSDPTESIGLLYQGPFNVSGTVTVKARAFKAGMVISAVATAKYNPVPQTYYVDALRSDDTGDGRSWATAKRTIQAAVDLSCAGDTVLVTNGIYNVGSRTTPGYTLKNRLIITNAVTVTSVNGPEVTVIEGSGTAAFNTANAVRCVYMINGILDGFSVRGGATYAHSTTYSTAADKGGAGVCMLSAAIGTVARNCIIRGNKAYDGGGVLGITHTDQGVGLLGAGKVINCLLFDNSASYGGASYWAELINCTVCGNSASADCGGVYWSKVLNSIAYDNGKNYHMGDISYSCTAPAPSGTGNTSAEPLFVDGANRDYRLLAGSPCIDAGNTAGAVGTVDLDGHLRIQNGTVDMGAYEHGLTLTLDVQGGAVSPSTLVVTPGAAYGMLPTPTKEGFVFGGWWTGLNGAGSQVTAETVVTETGSHSLYACWTALRFTLTVRSANGGEVPDTLTADHGSVLNLFVTNSPAIFGPTQYVCVGAAVVGNAFASLSPTNVTLTLTNDATLTWQWATNFLLATSVSGSGSVAGGGWYAAGGAAQLTAIPDAENLFTVWSDGELAATRTVSVPEGGAAYVANFRPVQRGQLRFTKTTVTVSETAPVVKLSVERLNGSDGPASVSYQAADGTAAGGLDYALEANPLQWGDGQAGTKSFYVEIADDDVYEGSEWLNVSLANATGASLGTPAAVRVNIQDNEEAPSRVIRLDGAAGFGDVPTNLTAALSVAVWNDGSLPLSVTNVSVPEGFAVTQQVFTVPAGASVALAVLFAPSEVRPYAGALELGSDATSGTAALALSGVGVAPVPPAGIRTIAGLTAVIAVDVPEAGASALGVEDALAPGLVPVSISDGGTWDAANAKVKWFFNEPGQVRDRALQYTVNTSGSVVTGLVSFGSSAYPVTGDTAFEGGDGPGLLHPADDNGDWSVGLAEVSGSVSRWRSGVDGVKTPVVVRGITLYLQGEQYWYSPLVSAEAKRWIPQTPSGAPSLPSGALALPLVQPPSGAVRSVQATNVTVSVTPAAGTSAWGMEESVPEGVQVAAVSDGGTWDAAHRTVKWAFFDGGARALSYSVGGEAGTNVTVSGTVSFDGSEDPVAGATVVAVPLPFATWAGQRGLSGDPETVFCALNAECGLPNGLVYAFEGSLTPEAPLLAIRWIGGVPVVETPRQDPATLSGVSVSVVGTADLENAAWDMELELSPDQSPAAANRCLWVTPAPSPRAFFKIRATLK